MPPKNTRGVTTRVGIKFKRSKLSDQIPIMNPNKEKLTTVIIIINIIKTGYLISRSTNKLAVANMIMPISMDFVAAAPT